MSSSSERLRSLERKYFSFNRLLLFALYLGTFCAMFLMTPIGFRVLLHDTESFLLGLLVFVAFFPGMISVLTGVDQYEFLAFAFVWILPCWVVAGVLSKAKLLYYIFLVYCLLSLGSCWGVVLYSGR